VPPLIKMCNYAVADATGLIPAFQKEVGLAVALWPTICRTRSSATAKSTARPSCL